MDIELIMPDPDGTVNLFLYMSNQKTGRHAGSVLQKRQRGHVPSVIIEGGNIPPAAYN
jgi:hypothetical protein